VNRSRDERLYRFRVAFVAASALWAVALPLSTFAVSGPASGSASAGRTLAWLAYAIGSLVCHQRPDRSFHLAGMQLPVCARCTGIYAGAALLSLLSVLRFDRHEERRNGSSLLTPILARRLLVLGGAPAAVTILFEWTTGVIPGHWLRALSGVPLGGAVAWIVSRSLERESFRYVIH
jgi:uncharacterized membrane protein